MRFLPKLLNKASIHVHISGEAFKVEHRVERIEALSTMSALRHCPQMSRNDRVTLQHRVERIEALSTMSTLRHIVH